MTRNYLEFRALAVVLIVGALFAAATSSVKAGGGGGSLSPSAKIRGHCFSATVTQPATIQYDPIAANFSSAATGVGHLLVKCTFNTVGTIDMSHGLNGAQAGASAYFIPQMVGTGATPPALRYFIYSAPAGSGLWGTTTSADGGSSAGSTVAIVGTGSDVDYPFYILIPPDQNVPVDSYTDTVTATVTF